MILINGKSLLRKRRLPMSSEASGKNCVEFFLVATFESKSKDLAGEIIVNISYVVSMKLTSIAVKSNHHSNGVIRLLGRKHSHIIVTSV